MFLCALKKALWAGKCPKEPNWHQNIRLLKKCWVIFCLMDKEITLFFHLIWWHRNLKREKETCLSRGWLSRELVTGRLSHFQHREWEGLHVLRMDVLGLRGQVCLDQKSGFHSTSHLPRGSSLWNLFFLCKVVFLKHATTEKQGLSSCEELSPAVCRSCFPRLPAGHQSGSLGLCSATVPFPDCLAQSTCSQQDRFQPVSIWGIKHLLQHLLAD